MNRKQRTTIGALALVLVAAIGCHDDRLAAVLAGTGIYRVGDDGNLYHRIYSYDSGLGQKVWGPWVLVGKPPGLKLTSGPAVECGGVIAAVASDHQVWVAEGSDAFGWVWFSLPGVYTVREPALTCSGQRNNLDVYVTGFDNAVWHRAYDPPSASWYAWESLGGSLTSGPAAVGISNRVDVFARDNTNGISHIWWNKTTFAWSAWEALGGGVVGNPSAMEYSASTNPQFRLDVYVQGTDHNIFRRTYQYPSGIFPGTWLAWEVVGAGGCAASSPTATSLENGYSRRVYVRGCDNPANYYQILMSGDGTYGGTWTQLFSGRLP